MHFGQLEKLQKKNNKKPDSITKSKFPFTCMNITDSIQCKNEQRNKPGSQSCSTISFRRQSHYSDNNDAVLKNRYCRSHLHFLQRPKSVFRCPFCLFLLQSACPNHVTSINDVVQAQCWLVQIVSVKPLENCSLSDSNNTDRLVVIHRSRYRTQCDHCRSFSICSDLFSQNSICSRYRYHPSVTGCLQWSTYSRFSKITTNYAQKVGYHKTYNLHIYIQLKTHTEWTN